MVMNEIFLASKVFMASSSQGFISRLASLHLPVFFVSFALVTSPGLFSGMLIFFSLFYSENINSTPKLTPGQPLHIQH
jgi:hypothetical protein